MPTSYVVNDVLEEHLAEFLVRAPKELEEELEDRNRGQQLLVSQHDQRSAQRHTEV